MIFKQNKMNVFGVTIFCLWVSSSNAAISAKIVGGQSSKDGQWPWIAALIKSGQSNYKGQFCGGSLIDSSWIITAAHCVENTPPDKIQAAFNLFNLKTDIGQKIAIKRILIHPNYNAKTIANDIALLQLKKSTTQIPILPLLNGKPILTNTLATIIGWGALSEKDSEQTIYPDHLYDATLPIISNNLCQQAYGTEAITNGMLCAGFDTGGVDTCAGDSGGPLVIYQNNKWRLAGITSWGDGCAKPGFYGVYTRVSYYIGYISSILKTNFFALADVNHDKILNILDKNKKNKDLREKFQLWVKQCWAIKSNCADVNNDKIINQKDYTMQVMRINNIYKTWLTLYWQPETAR